MITVFYETLIQNKNAQSNCQFRGPKRDDRWRVNDKVSKKNSVFALLLVKTFITV